MKLYNTLGRKETNLDICVENPVTIYHCGPTVYWTQHIGNMRAVYVVDVLVRTLKLLGYNTNLVRNITDVGHLTGDNIGDADTGVDRMQGASERELITPEQIAKKYTDLYVSDAKKLGTLPPNIFPKATEHISEMILMIQGLIEKEYAYISPKAVYFDTSKLRDYTKLSGQNVSKLLSGSGRGSTIDLEKRNSADFSLWFFKADAHKNALQTWPSPFHSDLVQNGQGFPGWHIECSAMCKKYLGNTVDIHVGGIEHIPIHHTNEIAQSESVNGVSLANIWLHYEHLLVDNKKMSKSEGTSYAIDDLESRGFTALDLRYFFLQAGYRSKQNFTWEALEASSSALKRLYAAYNRLPEGKEVSEKYISLFKGALSNDLATPGALSLVWELLKDSTVAPENKSATLLAFDNVLGLSLGTTLKVEIPMSVICLAEKRVQAKKEKDFKLADELRDEIESMGFKLIDTNEGYSIKLS